MKIPNRQITVDTGFFLALNNPKDPYHEQAKTVLYRFPDLKWVTTWPVMTETYYLLRKYRGESAHLFLKNYECGAFDVFQIEKEHMSRLCDLMASYHELPMDLADATLVVLAEVLGHGRILTSDIKDFQVYRWGNKKTFENLLLA